MKNQEYIEYTYKHRKFDVLKYVESIKNVTIDEIKNKMIEYIRKS